MAELVQFQAAAVLPEQDPCPVIAQAGAAGITLASCRPGPRSAVRRSSTPEYARRVLGLATRGEDRNSSAASARVTATAGARSPPRELAAVLRPLWVYAADMTSVNGSSPTLAARRRLGMAAAARAPTPTTAAPTHVAGRRPSAKVAGLT